MNVRSLFHFQFIAFFKNTGWWLLFFLFGHLSILGQEMQGASFDVSLAKTEVQAVCPSLPNSVCINPPEGVTLVVYDCATITASPGIPPISINVPQGQDLRFSILSNPDSAFRTFAVVSQDVANGNGVDPCVGGPGVFIGPVPVDANDSSSPAIHQIPSAVVDQLGGAFKVGLTMDCVNNTQLFIGMGFTRDPGPASTDLSVALINAPSPVAPNQPFTVDLQVSNIGSTLAQQPSLTFPLPIGTTLLAGTFGGANCTTNGNQVTCQTADLAPAEIHNASFTFLPELFGKIFFTFNAQALNCDENQINNQRVYQPFVSRPSDTPILAALGQIGDGIENDFWIYNPTSDPVDFNLFATDFSCSPSSTPFLGEDFIARQIQPRESMTISSNATEPISQEFIFWISSSSPGLIAEHRTIKFTQAQKEVFNASAEAFADALNLNDLDPTYPIPFFEIGDGIGQEVFIANLSNETQTATTTIRKNSDGSLVDQIIQDIDPLAIKRFPLSDFLLATEDQTLWATNQDGLLIGIYGGLETGQFFESYFALEENVFNPAPFRQAFFRPNPASLVYDPSELKEFRYKRNGEAYPSHTVNRAFGGDCDSPTQGDQFDLYAPGSSFEIVTSSLNILGFEDMGGFVQSSEMETRSATVWREGNSQVLIKATPPKGEWVVRVPKVRGNGSPGPRNPQNLWGVYSTDSPSQVSVAAFDRNGDLLGAYNIDLPSGGGLVCMDDIMDAESDILEFHDPFPLIGTWFETIADEPVLEYKDVLPKLTLNDTRIREFNKALAAWNGEDGTSCLGDAPDVLDIVSFMNDGLKCP